MLPSSNLSKSQIDKLGEQLFQKVTIVDRREQPSHGYRAVHAIVELNEKQIEVQVRTSLQHLWAELSEKFSDVVNPGIKYGYGDEEALQSVERLSWMIYIVERFEEQWPSGIKPTAKPKLLELLAETRDNIQKKP